MLNYRFQVKFQEEESSSLSRLSRHPRVATILSPVPYGGEMLVLEKKNM